MVGILAGGCAAPGCATPCRGEPLEIRPQAAVPIDGTRIACPDEGTALWSACADPFHSHLVSLPQPANCESIQIFLGDSFIGYQVRLTLFPYHDGALEDARADVSYSTDEEGPVPPPPALIDGWISPGSVARDGRNTGFFELRYAEGTIRGQYDASPP